MESGAFPDVVPFSVKREIFENFYRPCRSKTANTTMETDVTMGVVETHVSLQNDETVDKISSENNLQMLAKTPVWVIAHCLDRPCPATRNISFIHAQFKNWEKLLMMPSSLRVYLIQIILVKLMNEINIFLVDQE